MRRFLILPLVLCLSATAWAGQEYGAQAGDEVKPGELIVRLKAGALSSVILSYLPTAQVTPIPHLNLFHVKAQFLPASVASLLAADGLVDFVEPNRVRHSTVGQPNDPDFSLQWPLTNLGAVQAWTVIPNQYLTSATAGTNRIKVAVLDTGVDCTHPDFINSGASSTDSALGGQLLWSASHAFVATAVPSPACPWQDDFGHGTHVAGIIAASANNGTGVAGLAYPVQVVAYKVLDNSGSGTDVTIANAIMSAADAGIPIISLSLGGAGYSQTLQLAVNYAWQRNSLVIAAAGNDASSEIFYPADANYAVGVSATDINSNFASFSNFGNGVDIAGPGVNVLSTMPTYPVTLGNSPYGTLSGTSMATPHVSAVAGLVATTTPGTSVAAILLRLQQTATSTTPGGGWNQDFGYGIVHAYDAVSGTLRSATNGGVTGQIIDSNGNPIANATVTINGSSVTTDGSGLYRLGTFSAGTYAAEISASSFTTQNLTVTVPPGGDAPLTVMMGVSYGEFTGTVTDHGVAVPNAVVQGISANLIQGTAFADITGHYNLWVPAGTYSLLVTNIGEGNSTLTGQTVAAGGTTTANVTIAQLGSLSGTVTSPTGSPIASASVSITGGTFPILLNTSANGQFSVSGLASGTYTVTCSDFGYVATTVAGLVVSPESVANGNCQLGGLPVGWYNTSWSNRKVVTIDHTKVSGSGDLANFPVLISLPSDANLAGTAQAGGNDILFTGPDGQTKLSHEIESYNSSTGTLLAWVQVPSVSYTTDTVIYMYYGNASATNQQNAVGTWDSSYGAVLHLPNGTTISYKDSTTNNLNFGTYSNGTAGTGKIGGGGFIGGGRYIGSYPTFLNIGNAARTISCWFKTDGSVGSNGYYNICGFSWLAGGFGFKLVPSQSVIGLATGVGTSTANMRTIPYSADSAWHYLTATLSGGQNLESALIYLDGVPLTTSGGSGITVNTNATLDSGQWDGDGGATATGNSQTDELRYSKSVRSAGWIATEYSNQNSPSTFFSVGGQQNNGGGSTVSITVTSVPTGLSVTVDGTNCTTPCAAVQWTPGSSHTLAAATQAGATGTQYVFGSWTGSAASPDQVTAPSVPSTYTASFTAQYLLTTVASPSSEGSINPASEWVNAGTGVSISATAATGNQFTGFTGALTGTTTPQTLTMNAPATVTANFSPVGGPSWYSASWSNRKPITVIHTQVSGGASLTNFPVLISLPSDANLAGTAQAGGNDILFTGPDGQTKLSHEIESYNSSTGTLLAWVQVPSVSYTTDTVIYMYYGNASATNQQNAVGTWDSSYGAVLHLPNGTTISYKDSTTNNLNFGTYSNGTAGTGKIGGGGFIGGGRYIGSYPTFLNIGNAARTISCWFKTDGSVGSNGYYNICGFSWLAGGFGFKLVPSQSVIGLATGVGTSTANMRTIPYSADSAWHYLTATLSGGQNLESALIYLDGVPLTTSGGSGITVNTNATLDSGQWDGDGGATATGNSQTDELRYSKSVRSAGWIATEYSNQNSPSTFFSVGGQQNNGGGSTVSITVTSVPTGLSVTVDGTNCTTPCAAVQWTPGSSHTLAAATQAGATGTQYVFGSWTGSAASPDQVTAPSVPSTYTASFTAQYLLTTVASPSSEGSINPASEWVNAGTGVSISATAATGNQFTGFTGALTGTTTPQTLTMNAPATVTANFSPVGGPSWYSASWSNRKPITVIHTQVSGGASLTNFPVLISLPSDANLAGTAQAGGNDILFTGPDGQTKLSHEIESYNSSTGTLLAWVQVPSVSYTTDTVIYMYYGNASATNQQNAVGTWDSSYGAVLHLPNGTTISYKDSTTNNLNFGTYSNGTAGTGKIGGGGFIGGGRYIGSYPTFLNIGNAARTISCWFKTDGSVGSNGYYNICGFSWLAGGFGFKLVPSQSVIGLATGVGTSTANMRTIPYSADSAWHYLTATLSGGQNLESALIYLDGVPLTTSGGSGITVNTNATLDSGQWDGDGGATATGNSQTDELRYSKSVRSAGWIATEYSNQNSPSTFFSVGGQQNKP